MPTPTPHLPETSEDSADSSLEDDYKEEYPEDRSLEHDNDTLAEWLAMDPYLPFKAVLRAITGSHQHIQRFRELVAQVSDADGVIETAFSVVLANDTRWHSNFDALDKAIRLKTYINVWITEDFTPAEELKEGSSIRSISPEDWIFLKVSVISYVFIAKSHGRWRVITAPTMVICFLCCQLGYCLSGK